ncbi:tRNA (adenosine(37)-N6)-threonylcarbamoyltransferase complex ATPase subunit type 1 TsaE [Microbacterium lushaniae]|nr:tRNA (adenosine(37)-N6)-threonylcarbamoyltransferase complex ATPase subunit type 1 TsaE [Microbacterium lushaniae]KAA9153223.1 tRNA (adenosine(37)-N6)-threonylcarbamoyltransferase complex ATPase subunit type 1 TsaE [Microbacterium lushaniae]
MSIPDDLLGTREIDTPDAMHDLGVALGRMLDPGDVVVLTGGLGAGKTTLTRGIGEGLGIRGPVQSPTFVIARTHPSLVGGAPLVHVDAYRLGSAVELDDLDIDVPSSVVIVEWGRGMAEHLAEQWWEIEITPQTGGRGLDSACGTIAGHTAELDADAPRTVSITRHP